MIWALTERIYTEELGLQHNIDEVNRRQELLDLEVESVELG